MLILNSLPTRWDAQKIIINDAVILGPPYGVDDCKAPKEKQQALAQIKRVVEGYWSKKGGKPQTKGPQGTGGNSNPRVATPLPRKGG
jgi:hypothetical protein